MAHAGERRQQMKYDDTAIKTPAAEPKEGDLYAVVHTFGKTFELKYGYYDDMDRSGPPDVIYPDFIEDPVFSDSGEPIVTMMQDACPHYKSGSKRTDDNTCGECDYFSRGAEWFGICKDQRKIKTASTDK